MNEEDDWFDKMTDSHFLEVGRAATEWGELEMLIYQYLERAISSESLYGFLTKKIRGFEGRCELLLHVVRADVVDKSRTRALEQALATAKKLTEKRNLLAHNPMKFWIDDTEIKGGIIHSRSGNEMGLDLTAVKNFISSTHEVRYEIMNAMIEATGRGVR